MDQRLRRTPTNSARLCPPPLRQTRKVEVRIRGNDAGATGLCALAQGGRYDQTTGLGGVDLVTVLWICYKTNGTALCGLDGLYRIDNLRVIAFAHPAQFGANIADGRYKSRHSRWVTSRRLTHAKLFQ